MDFNINGEPIDQLWYCVVLIKCAIDGCEENRYNRANRIKRAIDRPWEVISRENSVGGPQTMSAVYIKINIYDAEYPTWRSSGTPFMVRS